MLQTINMFRVNDTGCDVVLVSQEGTTYNAHSLMLKAGSPYFKQVLESSDVCQGKTFVQISSSEKVLGQILEFLYTGRVVIDLGDVQPLRQLSKFFSMPTLEALCDQCGFGIAQPEDDPIENAVKIEKVEDDQAIANDPDMEALDEINESQLANNNQQSEALEQADEQQLQTNQGQVPPEDAELLAQMSQSVNGEIQLMQQRMLSVGQQQDEEDGVGQVILDIPVDMLPLEMQPQNIPPAKTKPSKIYRYKCGYCEKTFSHKYRLKGHQATAHFGRKAHKCHLCERSYTQLEYLREHLTTHSAEKRFECRVCNKKFQTMRVMKKHEKTHRYRMEEKFKCHLCGKVLSSKIHLEKHLVSHSGVRNYKCGECDKAFMYAEGLLKHKQSHVLGGVRECSTCKQRFNSPKELKEHSMSEHPAAPKKHQCDICGKAFSSEGWLNKHIIDLHAEDGKDTFKCLVCGVDFTQEGLLKFHMETIHVDEFSEKKKEEEKESPEKEGQIFGCQQCSKVFKRKFALKEHIRTHTGEKPFVCQYCSKAYASSSNLRKHEKAMHNAEKLAAQSNSEDILVQLYKCGACCETFGELGDLQDHVLTHKKLQNCSKCSMNFPNKTKLQEHTRSVHARVKYTCDLCNKGFSLQRHLASHFVKIHDINGNDLREKMLKVLNILETDEKDDDDGEVNATSDPKDENMQVLHVKEISKDGTVTLENSTGEQIDSKDFEMCTLTVQDGRLPVVLVADPE